MEELSNNRGFNSKHHTFMGVQKPLVEIKEIVRKEQDLKDLISSISYSISPKTKDQWKIGSFEAKGETSPKSLDTLKSKLLYMIKSIDSSLEEGVKEKKIKDNDKQLVELTAYCLELLKNYQEPKKKL